MDHSVLLSSSKLLLVPSVVPVPVIDVSALRRDARTTTAAPRLWRPSGARASRRVSLHHRPRHRGRAAGSHAAVGAPFFAPGRRKKDRWPWPRAARRGGATLQSATSSPAAWWTRRRYLLRPGGDRWTSPAARRQLLAGPAGGARGGRGGLEQGFDDSSSSSEGGDLTAWTGEAATGMAEAVADLKPAVTDFMATGGAGQHHY